MYNDLQRRNKSNQIKSNQVNIFHKLYYQRRGSASQPVYSVGETGTKQIKGTMFMDVAWRRKTTAMYRVQLKTDVAAMFNFKAMLVIDKD
jgi:hypothetical protein